MKSKKLTKKDTLLIITFIVLITIIILYFIINYVKKEIDNYKLYSDATMGNTTIMLSYNKSFDIQYSLLVDKLALTKSKKYTKGELIYDFAKYQIIPILNYLYSSEEDQKLFDSFSLISEFLEDFNVATYKNRQEILVPQIDKKNYYYENGIYTYEVRKKVIGKKLFNNMYFDYIKSNNVSNYFINKLFKKLNNNYSIKELENEINKNYANFYNKNKDIIIEIISDDLKNFCEYLNKKYLRIPKDEYGNRTGLPEIINELDTIEITLEYKFKKLDRIYSSISKYYRYNYLLDLDYLFSQLRDYDLPILYC